MEIGGTSAGHNWQMTAAEIATIQNGFNSITFGSSSHTANIDITDAVSFSDNVIFRQDQSSAAEVDLAAGADFTTTDDADASFYVGSGGFDQDLSTSLNIAGDLLIQHTTAGGNLAADGNMNVMGNATLTGAATFAIRGNNIIGGNLTIDGTSGSNTTFIGATTIDVGGNFNHSVATTFNVTGAANFMVDGDVTIESKAIALNTSASISGNVDGSSNLTFLEYGENAAMEIGGTSAGHIWQMTDTEIATIQNGFNSITFGSSSMTGDVVVEKLDLSSLSADVNIYGNDIDLDGLAMGAGDVMVHAINNGGDLGNLDISADITRAVDGSATLDLRADANIVNSNNANIIASDANSDGDFDSSTSADSLNVILNADRDASQSGAVSFTGSTITTNGGSFSAGGGVNPAITMAYGDPSNNEGIQLNNVDINTGAGSIIVNGHGRQNNANGSRYGVHILNGSRFETTSGNITIAGTGGIGTDKNHGVYLQDGGTILTSVNGDISITGIGNADAVTGIDMNYGIHLANGANIISTGTGAGAGTITLNGTGGDGSQNNHGIYLDNADITSTDGAISLTGAGGDGSSVGNTGISFTNGSNIESLGAGVNAATITLNGTGGDGTSNNLGINAGASASFIRSAYGDIVLIGVGGNGSSNWNTGISLTAGTTNVVISTGTGAGAAKITLNGTGGDGNDSNSGVLISGRGVASVDGDITISGTGANGASGNDNHGFYATSDAKIISTNDANISLTGIAGAGASTGIVTSGGTIDIGESGADNMLGNIIFIANSLSLADAALKTDGTFTLRQYTNGTEMGLGTGTTSGGLGLEADATELAMLNASSYVFGNANTGAMKAGGVSLNANQTYLADSIDVVGNIDAGANILTITADTGAISNSVAGTLTADTLYLDAAGTITADVNVTTALDIANNSSAAALTGLFQGGASQIVANAITGGPRNDVNYHFEGFTIGYVAPSSGSSGGGAPVIPAVDDTDAEVVETPEPPVVEDHSGAPTGDGLMPTDAVNDTSVQTPTVIENSIKIPSTVEVNSQNPEVGAQNIMTTAPAGFDPAEDAAAATVSEDEAAEEGEAGYALKEGGKTRKVLGGLITIHPALVKLLGLEKNQQMF